MQIHPALIDYKELWREPVCTDDRGNDYDLVSYQAWRHDIDIYEDGIKVAKQYVFEQGVLVMASKLHTYTNGATAYESMLFFKSYSSASSRMKERIFVNPFIMRVIKGYRLYPIFAGENSYFEKGVNFIFHVVKDSEVSPTVTTGEKRRVPIQ